VDLKPETDWRKGIDKPAILAQMDAEVSKIPGLEPSFSQPIRDNVLESISQIDGQIVIKVFGDDLDVLRDQAEQVLKRVSTVPGVARAFVDRLGELPQIQVRVDRARAARYGLNVADVQDVIESALGGKAVTQVWEGEQRFAVAVRLPDEVLMVTATQTLSDDMIELSSLQGREAMNSFS
jgi:cobalt-zinc-cadmium resistance protein CzcA